MNNQFCMHVLDYVKALPACAYAHVPELCVKNVNVIMMQQQVHQPTTVIVNQIQAMTQYITLIPGIGSRRYYPAWPVKFSIILQHNHAFQCTKSVVQVASYNIIIILSYFCPGVQWWIQDLVKEGSSIVLRAKSARKFLRPRQLWLNHAHFRSFWRETSCSTCQSIRFRSRSILRHAKVSHRSSYLCSPAREEGSIQPIISTCQYLVQPKGGIHGSLGSPSRSATGVCQWLYLEYQWLYLECQWPPPVT